MSTTPMAILWVRGGPDDGATIALSDGTTLMGRSHDNDIVVDEAKVSRNHAGIRKNPNGYWLEDLGSRNGTFVNGIPIAGEGQLLRDEDRIELGGADSPVHWIFREIGATVEISRPIDL